MANRVISLSSRYEIAGGHGGVQGGGRRVLCFDVAGSSLCVWLSALFNCDPWVRENAILFCLSKVHSVSNKLARTYVISILSQLPEYLKNNGWRSPDDAHDGPFQYATGSKRHYFDFLATQPHYQQAFNTVMKMPERRRGQDWFDFFPVEEKLSVRQGSDSLLVDIGGNQGRDITEFNKRFPDLRGKLVLEDLPAVVCSGSNLPPNVQVQGYNFFDEQPVKGAKAYYLRTVLHDWPDKQARQILARIQEAMAPDSLLLINEVFLPESNVALSSSYTDWTMMAMFASLERTKGQFERLLDESGFKLVNVWMPNGLGENSAALANQPALLEAMLKQA